VRERKCRARRRRKARFFLKLGDEGKHVRSGVGGNQTEAGVGLAEGWGCASSGRAPVTPRPDAAPDWGRAPEGEGRKSKMCQEVGGRTPSSREVICYSIPLGQVVV